MSPAAATKKAETPKPIDWSSKDSMATTFPQFKQKQLENEKKGIQMVRNVEIDNFSLKSPYGDKDIFVDTKRKSQLPD